MKIVRYLQYLRINYVSLQPNIAVALMALALSSCKKDVSSIDASKLDNTVEKCWHTTTKGTYYGIKISEEDYRWRTEREVVLELQAVEKSTKYTCTYEAAPKYKDWESCTDANAAVK